MISTCTGRDLAVVVRRGNRKSRGHLLAAWIYIDCKLKFPVSYLLKQTYQWGRNSAYCLKEVMLPGRILKTSSWYKYFFPKAVRDQGWLWPQWAVRSDVRTFPRLLGHTGVLSPWSELFELGFEIRWLCNALECSLCCLVSDFKLGALEIVWIVFVFECVLHGSKRFASLQAKSLAIEGVGFCFERGVLFVDWFVFWGFLSLADM